MLVLPLFAVISSGLLCLAKPETVDDSEEAEPQRGQRIGITSSFSPRHRTRATTLPPNWSLVGCFSDDTSTRALQKYSTTTSTNTPASCMSTCLSLGYSLAGVEYAKECYCGNSITTSTNPSSGQPASSADCSTACTGDSSQSCGGGNRIQIYTYTAPLPSGWVSVGCFSDDSNNRALSAYSLTSTSNTPGYCANTCQSKGYQFSGVEFGQECYCSNSITTSSSTGVSVASSKCSMVCTGNQYQTCGAGNYIQIFQSGSSRTTGTTTTTSTTKTSSTSTAITTSTTSKPSTTSTTSSSAPTTTSTWTKLGCYQDSNTRALAGYSTTLSSNTPSSCQVTCRQNGYTFAGVEYGNQCYCGSSITTPSTSIAESNCAMACAGDSTQQCGGSWAVEIYSLSSKSATSKTTSSSVKTTSKSSTSISKSSPTSTTPTTTSSKTSTSTTSSGAPTTTGWSQIGCYQDSNTRALAGYSTTTNSNTPASCQALCLGMKYTFAGVEYGTQCYCGSSITTPSTSLAESSCAMPCGGDSTQQCGGSWAVEIYSFSVSSGSTSMTTATSTTTKVTTTTSSSSATSTQSPPAVTKNVIIQMFEWTWDSVATECTQYIGPAGYGAVQVSPATEHITGPQWWTDYQPVSYILTSKRGNRAQYQNMINACHAAGVQVIADSIWNHMSAQNSGTGVAGTAFTYFNYPNNYVSSDFHYCGLEPNNVIVNYNNRLEVQTCELVGLADLATDTEKVRARLAQYGNDLLSLGVDGFRLDASKHIPTTDIANILSRLTSKPYITQEVIYGAGEPITPAEYVQNGAVQEFRYTTTVQNAFQSSGISSLSNLANQGWVPDASANVFVANHDTERNGNSLNYRSSSNTYTLAHVFMLAWPYGRPTVTSGYTWSSTDDGAPNGGAGTCYGNGGVNGWLCEHRWPAIVGMVGFKNNVGSSAVTNYITSGSQRIAFGRGSFGYVVINNVDSTWSGTFTTSLPDGVYCDVSAGMPSGKTCAGSKYTVSGGTFSATIGSRSALALHTGALSS